jgi:hypothetical protein
MRVIILASEYLKNFPYLSIYLGFLLVLKPLCRLVGYLSAFKDY